MHYLSFTIRGYKPLQYGGINKLQIDSFESINVLTGENGKGKSSLLRELTPYPATRTDYDKDGYKQLVFEHDGHIGISTSDFSKREGPHSFQWDGVELNVSGTTEVQIDQVELQCNHNRLVEKLMSGGCKFSVMSRNERRQLLMSTYPGSLEFVLDKHRNLMTQIRSVTSQLKLLKGREVELRSKLQDESIRDANRQLMQMLGEACHAVDMDLYHYQQQLDQLPVQVIESTDLNRYQQAAKRIFTQYMDLIKQGYRADNSTTLTEQLVIQETTESWLKDHLNRMAAQGDDLRERLESDQSSLASDPKATMLQIQSELNGQLEIIKSTNRFDQVPILVENPQQLEQELTALEPSITRLNGFISEHQRLLEPVELETLKTQVHELEYEQLRLQDAQTKLLPEIKAKSARLERYQKYTYPSDCNFKCSLRETIAGIIKQSRQELNNLQTELEQLDQQSKRIRVQLADQRQQLDEYNTVAPILNLLSRYFETHSWNPYVVSDTTLIATINHHGLVEVVNRAKRVIKNTYQDQIIKQAQDRAEFLRLKLDAIKNANLPSRKRLEQIVQSERNELQRLTEQLKVRKNQYQKVVAHKQELNCHQTLVNQIEQLQVNLIEDAKKLVNHKIREFLQWVIDDLRTKKLELTKQLGELELSVQEQQNLATRLNDEILPTQQQLARQLTKFEAVEKELSPASGLPKKFMVNYINKLIERANSFIAQIWNYDMELVYLKPEDPCDYTFPVLINHDGRVKDIAICSKGQKEIIDLALILALSTCRGYASAYPLKLDEMSSGLSPDHNLKLFGFLGELFSRKEIGQSFIVSHDPIVSDGFGQAGYIALSNDKLPELCKMIVKTE